jgi:hypothetical protein
MQGYQTPWRRLVPLLACLLGHHSRVGCDIQIGSTRFDSSPLASWRQRPLSSATGRRAGAAKKIAFSRGGNVEGAVGGWGARRLSFFCRCCGFPRRSVGAGVRFGPANQAAIGASLPIASCGSNRARSEPGSEGVAGADTPPASSSASGIGGGVRLAVGAVGASRSRSRSSRFSSASTSSHQRSAEANFGQQSLGGVPPLGVTVDSRQEKQGWGVAAFDRQAIGECGFGLGPLAVEVGGVSFGETVGAAGEGAGADQSREPVRLAHREVAPNADPGPAGESHRPGGQHFGVEESGSQEEIERDRERDGRRERGHSASAPHFGEPWPEAGEVKSTIHRKTETSVIRGRRRLVGGYRDWEGSRNGNRG